MYVNSVRAEGGDGSGLSAGNVVAGGRVCESGGTWRNLQRLGYVLVYRITHALITRTYHELQSPNL